MRTGLSARRTRGADARPPLALMLALMLASREARAARPIELTVSVNDDLPGSGYSEITPENRASRYVDSCRST
ncbi:MAG: hypothetical protein IPF92_08935 [Myxococcales bacterium]|nr:hypothetical protein [Myxococcales bacterium]